MPIDTINLTAWADLVHNGGLSLVVAALIVGGLRQWYVWGWVYRQMLQERDEWRDMVIQTASNLETAARKKR
jgi:hypothetical protein